MKKRPDALMLVPRSDALLEKASELDLSIEREELHDLTKKLSTAQKLWLAALAISRQMSEVGILIAEDALSQVKRMTCQQCARMLPTWFFVVDNVFSEEKETRICMHCVDDFPYPEPGVTEDAYTTDLQAERAVKLLNKAKLPPEKP
jgi:hypothetical protein